MDELKPCPFCGGNTANIYRKWGRNGWFIFAKCDVCGASSKTIGLGKNFIEPENESEFWDVPCVMLACDTAAQAWNMRH